MEIKFNKKLFNPLYWHIRKYTQDKKIRFLLIYGGSSAAKTYSVTQSTIYDTLCEADRYMVCRKVGSDIEDSIYSDFVGIINNWNLGKLFTCIKNKIDNISGAYIRFRGLDDSEKIKGISRFKRVILEELSQFTHEDFKQVRKRLRGRPGQQIIAMWNPISEEHWIKKEIIDTQTWIDLPKEIYGIDYSKLSDESFVRINEEGNTILIKTTYMDNFWVVGHPELSNVGFIDEHTIADFEFDRKHDYPYYRVYALGEWGKLDTGAEFYKAFNVSHSVKPKGYNPELPLHLSFDENVNPYVSCSIWQAEGLNALAYMHDKYGHQTDRYWIALKKQWSFIRNYSVDAEYGDWYWEVTADGKQLGDGQKANAWKACYHTGRSLMNVSRILKKLAAK